MKQHENIPSMRKRTSAGKFRSVFSKATDKLGVDIPPQDLITSIPSTKKMHRRSEIRVVKRPARRSTKVVAISASCIAVMLTVFLFINILSPIGFTESAKNFFAGVGVSGKFPVELSNSTVNTISSVGNDTALLTDSNINLYNSRGGRIFSRQHGYSNPKMISSESRILTYNSGSTGYRVDNRNTTVIDSDTSDAIICAAISDSGYYALTTYSAQYICETTVYSSDGEARFRWNSSEQYIISIALSSTGRQIAIGSVGASGGLYKSVIRIFNINSEEAVFTQEYSDDLLLSLSYNGNCVGAVFENSYSALTSDYQKTDYSYDEEEITSFDNKNSQYDVIIVSEYNDSKKNIILVFDENGNTKAEIEYNDEVVSCCADDKYIYVLSKGKISKISVSDSETEEAEVPSDCTAIISRGSKIITVSSSYLSKVSF